VPNSVTYVRWLALNSKAIKYLIALLTAQIGYIMPQAYEIYCIGLEANTHTHTKTIN